MARLEVHVRYTEPVEGTLLGASRCGLAFIDDDHHESHLVGGDAAWRLHEMDLRHHCENGLEPVARVRRGARVRAQARVL